MKGLFSAISIICFFFSANTVIAQTCTATGGNWDQASSWGCGVVPTNPSYDTIIIPAGVTITVPAFSPQSFNGTIEVYGTLTVGLFSSLSMDASSTIQIYTNGTVNGFLSLVLIGGTPIGTFPGLDGPQALDNTGGAPLPVELIYFKANAIDEHVELSWATALEMNFDYFSLERSSDGKSFKEIARLNGTGNSFNRVDYEYLDEFPLSGLSYYRLTSIDFDGYTEVFDYAIVNLGELAYNFEVFPNPIVNNILSIQTNFKPEKPLDLIVVNNLGRIEAEYRVDDWLKTFEASNLQPGNYILKLVTPSGVIVKRILIK